MTERVDGPLLTLKMVGGHKPRNAGAQKWLCRTSRRKRSRQEGNPSTGHSSQEEVMSGHL